MGSNEIHIDEGWSQFHGPNLGYMLDIYEDYLENPNSVDDKLQIFFERWGAPNCDGNTTDTQEVSHDQLYATVNAMKLADSIRKNGHLLADISPVEERKAKEDLFSLERFQLTADALKNIPAQFLAPDAPSNVRNGLDAIMHLRKVYTDTMAFEFNQVHDMEERKWLIHTVESGDYKPKLTGALKKTTFESFK